MKMEMANVEGVIRSEIEAGLTRKQIAQSYRLGLMSSFKTDWAAVNKLILQRWSPSGLEWIKKQAWSGKCFEEPT